MLKKILKAEECKKCKWCCGFNKDDIWETPIVFPELKQYIEENDITVSFLEYKGNYLFDMPFEEGKPVVWCPMLTKEGCILKDNKPYDCRIWPFRVMRYENQLVITVSPVCKTVSSLSISILSDFVNDGFKDQLFQAAKEHPVIIKEYIEGYPILAIRNVCEERI